MKSLISLWSTTANELAVRCSTVATLDIKYVERRTKHEGISFLAISLASYGKVIQKWLDQGFVVSSDASSFRTNRHTGLPVFLQGFLRRVFVPGSGVLLDDPCIDAIFALRQLTLMFSKIADPGSDQQVATPKRVRQAMHEFVQCEHEVKLSDSLLDPQFLAEFKSTSEVLFGEMFAKVDRDIYWCRHIPKHGPGAVADRLSSNGRFNQRSWPRRLERVFPHDLFMFHSPREARELKHEVDFIEPRDEIPVRVIPVPKTLKSPRIIAIEPAAMQFAQQSVRHCILEAIKEDDFLYRLIGTDDQDPNRELARSGSLSGDLATLDLSEASDRVSNQHVRAMLEDYPHLHEAVQASRSRKADVPGHGVIRLAKFASMGSALCFPIESMVFATLILMGITRELSTPLNRREAIKLLDGRARVFGDDLIVPRDHVLTVVDELSTFGYKVNISKSFWIGRFRESCGREYYDGHDVSIVKVREVLPTRRQQVRAVESTVSLRNHFYEAGMWGAVRLLDSKLRKILKYFPNVGPTAALLGRVCSLGWKAEAACPETHAPLVKGHFVSAKTPPDYLDGLGAMLKCLLRMNPRSIGSFALDIPSELSAQREPCVDAEHLERAGRPEFAYITTGWVRPY